MYTLNFAENCLWALSKSLTVAINASPLPVNRVSYCITLTTKSPLFRWGCFRYNFACDSDVLVDTEHVRTIF